MTTAAMSVTHPRTAHGLERATLVLLLCFVASLQISIAAANILLALMLVCWTAQLVQDRTVPAVPYFFWPLVAYAAVTVAISAFSLEPATSILDDKQLVLFVIVPAVYQIARGERASLVVDVIVSIGAASAAYGIIQYGLLHYDNLGRRPEGAMSHYMTYSGLLMLVICAAAARLIFGRQGRTWPALVMPALVVALALTLGRSAWIGASVAIALLLALKDLRLTILLPLFVAVLFAVAPGTVTKRVMSIFDVQEPTNQDRLAMIEMGARMVNDHPLTGVGPNMVPRVYAQYRPDYAINPINPHLHNVPLQIAAERGLPALGVWLWFIFSLVLAQFRLFRRQRDKVPAAAALAAVFAMLGAGLFEYNFGDSEFLMLFLVLVTLPFAAARGDDESAAARA
ncbi:MAG TPA: O-antigen ligase family protein [Vicinamibacterales bacterium]|nr:O-antigen ligase family protein [Vicinamibacterales bacterium]